MQILAHDIRVLGVGDIELVNTQGGFRIPNSGSIVLYDDDGSGSMGRFSIAQNHEIIALINANDIELRYGTGDLINLEGAILTPDEFDWLLGVNGTPERLQDVTVSFLCDYITRRGAYTQLEFEAGIITDIFKNVVDLPAAPPSAPTIPAFAIIAEEVDLTSGFKVAYWDHFAATGWTVTTYPWTSPIFGPIDVVNQLFFPGGNSAWNYTMGSVFKGQPGSSASITGGSFYLGAAGTNTHTWQLRKSTITSVGMPALNTFTTVLEAGAQAVAGGSQWTDVNMVSSYPIAPNEWFMFAFCVIAGGSNFAISVARSGGDLEETELLLNNGCYSFGAGAYPGTFTLPLTNGGNNSYGCVSLKVV